MVTGAASVGAVMIVLGAAVFAAVIVVGLLAMRQHNRMFPKGWDRTGWEPHGTAGWLATKFTWLSGGRG
jgi:hypothetical protein